MPMIRDDGLPVSAATLNEARQTLSPEFGFKVVNDNGRNVLLVRVPRARPDYMHDLEGAAESVDLETLNSVKDVLLVGDEKVTRMDPLPLRDNIKARRSEDASLVQGLLKRLEGPYEVTTFKHNGKVTSTRLAVRIPRPSIAQITAEDIEQIRNASVPALEAPGGDAVSVFYVIADADFERLTRATFNDIIGVSAPAPVPPAAPQGPATYAAPGPAVNYAAVASSVPVAPAPAPQQWNGFPAPGPVAPAAPAAPIALPSAAPVEEAEETEAPVVEKKSFNDDTEVFVSKKPAPKPAAGKNGKPPADTRPVRQQVEEDPEAKILKASDEYVVYTSAKKSGPDPAEQNKPFLLSDLASLNRKAGKAGKDYEIMSGSTSPYMANAVSPLKAAAAANKGTTPASIVSPIMAAAAAARGHPAPQAAAPAPAPAAPGIAQAGAYATPEPVTQYAPAQVAPAAPAPASFQAPVTATPWGAPAPAAPVAAPAPVDPLAALLNAFNAGKYETIKDLNVGGNVFALAAHKNGGKRVLVKTVEKWDESQQTGAIQNAEALGADVLLVVARDVAPGARIAAWGTKLQIVTPSEAPYLSL